MKRLTKQIIATVFCLGLIPLWANNVTNTNSQKVVIQTNPAATSVTTVVHQDSTVDNKGNVESFVLTEYKPNDSVDGKPAIAKLESDVASSNDPKAFLATMATVVRVVEGKVNPDGTVTVTIKDAEGNVVTPATTYMTFKDAQAAISMPLPPAIVPTGIAGNTLVGVGVVGTPPAIIIVPESP
jgi:hypothetical protein